MKNLRKKVKDKVVEIIDEVEHGECFYEQKDLNDLLTKLEELRNLAIEYHAENQLDH